jgi:hypothetical protein
MVELSVDTPGDSPGMVSTFVDVLGESVNRSPSRAIVLALVLNVSSDSAHVVVSCGVGSEGSSW